LPADRNLALGLPERLALGTPQRADGKRTLVQGWTAGLTKIKMRWIQRIVTPHTAARAGHAWLPAL